ncbi:MAG TPA: SDR family oxidoreductase [Rubrivivax sp.]|nr:SDR family oxidoreductase [Rubrivivax sp.]
MHVLITGGAGFLGQRLARRLLALGALKDGQGRLRPIERLTLLDVVAAPDFGDPRVRVVSGDIAQPQVIEAAVDAQTGSVFHLAAIVSSQAEADFDLGMRINVDAFRLLLETCRRCGHGPKLVFTSSVAVYGGTLPALVLDDTALSPRSSYGVQKAIGELLLADFSRRGFVDGRGLRLPTISVRPGRPNQAASSFASGIIREPLHGEESVCPVRPDTRLWLLSPQQAVENLVLAHELPAAAFDGARIVNLPGTSVSVAEMLAALGRVAGDEVLRRVRWQEDATIQRIVGGWPAAWDATRALGLGFGSDADFESIIRAFIAEEQARR